MLNLIAFALFSITLVFSWIGLKKSGNTALRRFWILLGFSELLLAFICFVALPSLLYFEEYERTVIMIVFCVISLVAILIACLDSSRE